VVATPLAVAVGKIVPQGAERQDNDQRTPIFAESLVTVAVNCVVLPACRFVVTAETETLIGGGGVIIVLGPAPHPKLPTARTTRLTIAATDTRFLEFISVSLSLSRNQFAWLHALLRTDTLYGSTTHVYFPAHPYVSG
jgi:hypothetical protein